MSELILSGRAFDVLLGRAGCFVQSRYLDGHDHLLALYWLNRTAVEQNDVKDYAHQVGRALEHLLKAREYVSAANFITAVYAAMNESNWIIPVKFSDLASVFCPYVDEVPLSAEFREIVNRAARDQGESRVGKFRRQAHNTM